MIRRTRKGKTMKTLLAFSGGLDSSYILWKLLTETTEEVTVFYQNNANIDQNLFTEDDASKSSMIWAVVEEYKKIRPFQYVEYFTRPDELHPQLKHRNLLIIIQNYKKINDGTYDKLVFGSSYEDRHIKVVPHLDWTPTYYAERRLFKHVCTRGELSYPLCDGTWHKNYTKAYAMLNLPDEYKNLILSCNKPIFDETRPNKARNCETCKRCLLNRKYEEMLTSGYTPAQILKWRFDKNLEYGGGKLMAAPHFWIATEMGIPGASSKKEVIETFRKEGHFNLKGLKNANLWKDLL